MQQQLQVEVKGQKGKSHILPGYYYGKSNQILSVVLGSGQLINFFQTSSGRWFNSTNNLTATVTSGK